MFKHNTFFITKSPQMENLNLACEYLQVRYLLSEKKKRHTWDRVETRKMPSSKIYCLCCWNPLT